MIALQIPLCIVLILLPPCVIGWAALGRFELNMGLTALIGGCLSLDFFFVFAILSTFTGLPLHWVTISWSIMVLAACAYTVWQYKRQNKAMPLAMLKNKIKEKRSKLFWVMFGMVALQTTMATVLNHTDADDITYVGMAMTSYVTNTINQIVPETGIAIAGDHHMMAQYIFAPWPVYWAMVGQIVGLAPAIIMHTILPAVLVPVSYYVFFCLAKFFLREDSENAYLLVVMLCMLRFFGYTSVYTQSSFLLLRSWQGKAVLFTILIPLLMFLIPRLQIVRHGWMLLLVVVVACCCVSSMSFFLIPCLFGLYGALPALRKKKVGCAIQYLALTLPCFVLALWATML